MARAGDIEIRQRDLTKGDLSSEQKRYIDNGTSMPLNVALSMASFLMNPLFAGSFLGYSVSASIYDYSQQKIYDEINDLNISLKDRPDSTRICCRTEFKLYQKGSQGLFWIPTGKVYYTIGYCPR